MRTDKLVRFNRTSHTYESVAEAVAYFDGIRFANDSALDGVGIRENARGYEVLMWDADGEKDFKTRHIKKSALVQS